MMIEALAAIALQASNPDAVLCVQSRYDNGDRITFAISPERLNEFRSRARNRNRDFRIVNCARDWTASDTADLCEAIDAFGDDLKESMKEVYAIHPDDMCDASREAVGLSIEVERERTTTE
ncbi:MAG: hypothetical protein AAGD92_03210 [Pseudomonadota bacterium]